jgi:hypothetical protein
MTNSIDDILNNLFAAIESADYGTAGNGQGYDVKIYGVPELKELLANLGLIAPEASVHTLADVHAAVEGFHYNASSNFATLQTDILTTLEALIVENSPVIGGGDTAAFTINENTTDVASIAASDAQGDMLEYTLSGADEFLFDIDDNGVLFFKDAPDFEAPADAGDDNVYDVTVTVSDGAQTDSQDIAVTVTDVNEAPTDTPASPPFTEGNDNIGFFDTPLNSFPTVQIVGETWYEANMGGGDDQFYSFYTGASFVVDGGAGDDLIAIHFAGDTILTGGSGADTFQFGFGGAGNATNGKSMVITDFSTSEDSLRLAWLDQGLNWTQNESGDLVGSNNNGATVTLEGLDLSVVGLINLTIDVFEF